MNTSRRGFLGTLFAAVGTAVAAPVAKVVEFVTPEPLNLLGLNEIAREVYSDAIADQFFKGDPLLAYLRDHDVRFGSGKMQPTFVYRKFEPWTG
jgi:hypothetical protein